MTGLRCAICSVLRTLNVKFWEVNGDKRELWSVPHGHARRHSATLGNIRSRQKFAFLNRQRLIYVSSETVEIQLMRRFILCTLWWDKVPIGQSQRFLEKNFQNPLHMKTLPVIHVVSSYLHTDRNSFQPRHQNKSFSEWIKISNWIFKVCVPVAEPTGLSTSWGKSPGCLLPASGCARTGRSTEKKTPCHSNRRLRRMFGHFHGSETHHGGLPLK